MMVVPATILAQEIKMFLDPHTTHFFAEDGASKRFLHKLIHYLEMMPVAQGSIISVVVGITIGSIAFDDVQTAAFVSTWLVALMSIILGPITIWLIRRDQRKEKEFLTGSVIMLMIVSLLQLGFIGSESAVELLRNISLMMMFFSIFMMTVHGYSERIQRTKKR